MRGNDDPTGARAAVLGRFWGALAREPVPGVTGRLTDGDDLVLTLANGGHLRGPAAAARPFATVPPGFVITSETDHHDAGELLNAIVPPSPARDRLYAELGNSGVNLARARARAGTQHRGLTLADIAGQPGSLAYLEQSIVDGHPLHPLCRARMGLSGDDIMRYAPEFRPAIDLVVVAVPAERWLSTGAGLPPRLPMHPWQHDHVLARYPGLRSTGEMIRARPLMSLRTVALIDDPQWHLKTAVDVQMTSAVRTVSPAAIHNGPVVSRLLSMLIANEPLDILAEVAAGAVLVDGEPCRSLAVIRRQAPPVRPGEVTLPFAVLSARSPASGRAFVTEAIGSGDPAVFFERLIRVALPPLLRLLSAGVALEAHGQNLLLVLRDLVPVRVVYRDMGGLRISPRLLAAAGIEVPPIHGDLGTDDPVELRTKFAAAFLSTAVAEVIDTLVREYAVEPDRLWGSVAAILRRARVDALLGPTLPMKAMTAMRLAADPLEDIWTTVPNPMATL